MNANRQRAIYVPLLSFLPLIAQAAVLLVGGHMVASGELTYGDFFFFNVLTLMLVMPLRMLGMWIGQAQRATASGERIFEIIDEPEDIARRAGRRRAPAGRGPHPIRATSRSSTPTAGRCCTTSTSRSQPGDTVALIGHTGSGKTTLASLVPRFYDVERGRVTVDGVDVRDVTLASLRRSIGVVAQDPFLFSATVRENIAFGVVEATDEEVERAARLAQAHEFIGALPDGYDTVIGERGITLSGGQRQRLAIARALILDPRILILDDATASVDATTEARIRTGLREVMRDRTTIIIAHRLSTIALADELVVLDGRAHRGARHARRADRDEPGLPRHLRARPARARVRRAGRGARRRGRRARQRGRGGGVRVWQAGSHLTMQRGAEVTDWSWRRTRAARDDARPARRAVQAAHDARARVARAGGPRRPRAAAPGARRRQRHPRRRPERARAGPSPRSSSRASCSCSPSSAQTYFTGWTGERILADLRNRLFRHLQRLSLGYYERNRAGVIISRITNDVEALDQLVTDGVTTLVQNSLILVGSIVLLFYLDWQLALATLVVVPFMAVATALFRSRSSRAYASVRERLGLVTATLAEDINGMRVVQAFSRETPNMRRFQEVNEHYRGANHRRSS